MTETQLKMVKLLVVGMMSVSVYQFLVIRDLVRRLDYGRDQFNKLHDGTMYLMEIIEKNDIELTEFDLIALTAITEGRSNA